MEQFPSAIVIASYEAVCQNNNVLYRLVRPLPDGVGVQSTDRLVNVVPFRRKYMFEKKQQLDEFAQQMLRRPLVLQPVLHFGRGIGHNCALCYEDELWVVMVNQTHPKILSRLQMGLDAAKGALQRGQPFEIRFRFGKLIQRVYREHLAQKEHGEAQKSDSTFDECLTYFRYAEWEHCDLNLRYHGYGASINRTSAFHSLPNLEMKWDFEDIGMHEMEWSQFNGQKYPRPHLSPVFEDEIHELLPGWTINTVSPLQNIGDSIPENNYDYAQAGRLYASFRKKRQPRNKPQNNDLPGPSSYNEYYDRGENLETGDHYDEIEGAVGFDPSAHADFDESDNDIVEHDFAYENSENYRQSSQTRQHYKNVGGSPHGYSESHYQNNYQNSDQHLHSNYPAEHVRSNARNQPTTIKHYANAQSSNQAASVTNKRLADKYGHIQANVQIISNAPSHHYEMQAPGGTNHYVHSHADSFDTVPTSSSNYHPSSDPFEKQDSDRFSRSTTADSGYCPDGDEINSRGGSYDYNDPGYVKKLKQDFQNFVNVPLKTAAYDNDDGLENPAFTHDYSDSKTGLQKPKVHLSNFTKMHLEGYKTQKPITTISHNLEYNNQRSVSHDSLSPKESVRDMHVPPRRKKAATASNAAPQVAESFI